MLAVKLNNEIFFKGTKNFIGNFFAISKLISLLLTTTNMLSCNENLIFCLIRSFSWISIIVKLCLSLTLFFSHDTKTLLSRENNFWVNTKLTERLTISLLTQTYRRRQSFCEIPKSTKSINLIPLSSQC